MNALKCDRCGKYYDYDPTAKYNYISFGHKDIIPNKKQTTKDICPECMEKFIYWLENPDGWSPEECKRYLIDTNIVDPEKCKRYLNEKFGITNDDERLNELYKEAENISNSAGEEKVE